MLPVSSNSTATLKSTPDSSVCYQAYQKMVDTFGAENIYFDNMFDRQYLPSGMWNVISEGGCMLLNGTPKAEVGSYMDENFHVLYEEAHSKNNAVYCALNMLQIQRPPKNGLCIAFVSIRRQALLGFLKTPESGETYWPKYIGNCTI